ncbi:hypothetical protein EFA46_009360 [Halarchaeum sp. CBA1220]|uniref:hypothetical protein n=1 Tax=Halarchaeum sp. CBA1220 TaxID=1853682 RepID=UPI000F3A8B3F|nr:hypothetical protein [Halarchaeum sp. CBA1220]QLC34406.1 hypothetical protein EFA46_009360 [Halarchaeum sp. CBA1220]
MKVLYLTTDYTEYLQDQVLIGLKRLPDVTCVDVPRKDVVYAAHEDAAEDVHGGGFTVWGTLEGGDDVDREAPFERLEDGEFDLLVFGNVRRETDLFERVDFDAVPCPVAFLDGEDERYEPTPRSAVAFVREALSRRRRGMEVMPAVGSALYEPALDEGYYFKREKDDAVAARANVHPIPFSIPAEKIRDERPEKTQTFQTHVQCEPAYELPEVRENCTTRPVFDTEAAYYDDIAASRYGITMKKGGWECMRHYEIAANWTVPCFYELDDKPAECAPHGLRDLENCLSFETPRELRRKIGYVETNDLYGLLQRNAVEWVREHTCVDAARSVSDTVRRDADE